MKGIILLHNKQEFKLKYFAKLIAIIGVLALSLIFIGHAIAAPNATALFPQASPEVTSEKALGLGFGPTKGNGLSYRNINYETGIGYQVTALPLIGRDEGVIFGGVSALYVLHRGNSGIAYASLGAAGMYGWDNCGEDDEADCKDDSGYGYSFGPGVGFELRFWDNFGLSLEVPVAVLMENNKFAGIYPIPNCGLVYFW